MSPTYADRVQSNAENILAALHSLDTPRDLGANGLVTRCIENTNEENPNRNELRIQLVARYEEEPWDYASSGPVREARCRRQIATEMKWIQEKF